VAIAGRAAERFLGKDRVDAAAGPVMASEDFGVRGRHVPACLTFLGNGTEPAGGGIPLHSHDYVFNDDTLAAGIGYYREVARESLAED
jgi:metal-dependent amidase/aminoacylase/carboxypeptidase family protein